MYVFIFFFRKNNEYIYYETRYTYLHNKIIEGTTKKRKYDVLYL